MGGHGGGGISPTRAKNSVSAFNKVKEGPNRAKHGLERGENQNI